MAAFTPLFLLALLAVLAGPTCAMLSAEPAKTTVFAGGMGGFACFRIPAIVQTSNGSLLAFAEGTPPRQPEDFLPRAAPCTPRFRVQ